ncbi:acyl-CoA dehydratase activase [Abyssisolibacter fermentans]|uniref:acyl-CoA dehydratase activase n=1 Tax=Abyssisolibacter fermentans TaxID=1766203 RepID=UPI00082F6C72|nr:acyl-CoA dehydratase activase [Abyssisolibacter fermentans]
MENLYLGVDLGSVSTNIVLIDENLNVVKKYYLRTMGKPIVVLQEGMKLIEDEARYIKGVGTTGSGRYLASAMLRADIVKNEITTHAIAAINIKSNVRTILEIGGQDSKIVILRDGVVQDFAMNTVCAAGTGSFLDRQAARLGVKIEDFGQLALKSKTSVRIAGRCAVFAESDMIHKQQLGHSQEDIINGLCEALVRNYLNNVGKGKKIQEPIFFQGGVAANIGIKKAFEKSLNAEIYVPQNYDVMGAIGSAILAKEKVAKDQKTNFKSDAVFNNAFVVHGFECNHCSNMCEVIEILRNKKVIARWGDKCGRWSNLITDNQELA